MPQRKRKLHATPAERPHANLRHAAELPHSGWQPPQPPDSHSSCDSAASLSGRGCEGERRRAAANHAGFRCSLHCGRGPWPPLTAHARCHVARPARRRRGCQARAPAVRTAGACGRAWHWQPQAGLESAHPHHSHANASSLSGTHTSCWPLPRLDRQTRTRTRMPTAALSLVKWHSPRPMALVVYCSPPYFLRITVDFPRSAEIALPLLFFFFLTPVTLFAFSFEIIAEL